VKHIETLEHFVSRPAVWQDITAPMSDVETRTGRIRKHIQAVVFWPWIVVVSFVQMLRSPVVSPPGFNVAMVVSAVKRHLGIITGVFGSVSSREVSNILKLEFFANG
jgi:hypothetical protein